MSELFTHKIENGPRLVLCHDTQAEWMYPTVYSELVVGSGAAADPDGKTGLAHVTEHAFTRVLFRHLRGPSSGLAGFANDNQISTPNPITLLDLTRFHLISPLAGAREAFAFWRDCVRGFNVSDEDVAGCRAEVIAEKDSKIAKNPFARLFDDLYETAFTRHPYRWYTIGRNDCVAALLPADVREFARAHYAPANLTLSFLVTKLPATVSFSKLCEELVETYSGFRGEGAVAASVTEPVQEGLRSRGLKPGGPLSMVIGFKAPASRNIPAGAPSILCQALVGADSYFRQTLQGRDADIVIAGSLPNTRDPGIVELIVSSTRAFEPGFVLETLFEGAGRLGTTNGGVFSAAKERAVRAWRLVNDTTAAQLQQLAQMAKRSETKSYPVPSHLMMKLNKMTEAEVLGASAASWLREEPNIRGLAEETLAELARSIFTRDRATVVASA